MVNYDLEKGEDSPRVEDLRETLKFLKFEGTVCVKKTVRTNM